MMKERLEWRELLLTFFLLTISLFLLSGCSDNTVNLPEKEKIIPPKKVIVEKKQSDSIIYPISVPDGEFFQLVGLIDNQSAIYIANLQEGSKVFKYDLYSGKSNVIHESQHPIVNCHLSPSRSKIVIHAAPSTYEGAITVIDLSGMEIWKYSIPSVELAFEWNPYNEDEILVSSFNEDWTYKLFLLDMKGKHIQDIDSPQPFVKWLNKDEIGYIKWDEDNPELFAPLASKNIRTGDERILLEHVFQFSAYKDRLLTITSNDSDDSMADYSFFDMQMNKLHSFQVPQLTRFSDWLIPYYEFVESEKRLFMFVPFRSGDADSYQEGFQLMSFDLEKGKQEKILDGIEKNEPISCSPDGELCLLGNQLENLILMKEKKIIDLYKE
ncbi:hypothetical protein [Bacillus sp. cl95]|uniref:YqgU-like beta propeller domain-containing protein n=1 Tax=unclassified Bacillus (in: firmicutes) TaxID=185979 RepID=UPI0034A2443E